MARIGFISQLPHEDLLLRDLAAPLGAHGFEIDIYRRRDTEDISRLASTQDTHGLTYLTAGPAKPLSETELIPHMRLFSRQVRVTMRSQHKHYDLIAAASCASGVSAHFLKKEAKIPYVVHFTHTVKTAAWTDVLEGAQKIIVSDVQDLNAAQEIYDVPESKLLFLPRASGEDMWPVDQARAKAQFGIDADEPLLLHLGSSDGEGRAAIAAEAVKYLKERHELPARLLLVTPDDRQNRERLRYLFSAADVTLWDPASGTEAALEATACGTYLMAPRCKAAVLITENGLSGSLVSAFEADVIGEKLALLLKNPSALKNLGRSAHRRARDVFSKDAWAAQVSLAYTRAAGNRASRRPARLEVARHPVLQTVSKELTLLF